MERLFILFLACEKSVMNRNVGRSRDVCEPCHGTADIFRWTAIRTQCCSHGSTILNMQNDWREIHSSDIACFRSVRSIDYLTWQKGIILAIDIATLVH